tara:strand:+ start:61 stop:1551 length:1491 start_codon:yes stop_codon:yes gene_type:complete
MEHLTKIMLEMIRIEGDILEWKSPLELLFWEDIDLAPIQSDDFKKTPILVGINGCGKSLTAALIDKYTSFLSNPTTENTLALAKLMKKFKVDSIEFRFSNVIQRCVNGYLESTLPIGIDLGKNWDKTEDWHLIEISHNSRFKVIIGEKGLPIVYPSQSATLRAIIHLEEDFELDSLPDCVKDKNVDYDEFYHEEHNNFTYDSLDWTVSSFNTVLETMLFDSLKFAQTELSKIDCSTVNFSDSKNTATLPSKYFSADGFRALLSYHHELRNLSHIHYSSLDLRYFEYPLKKEIENLCFLNIEANRSVKITWNADLDMAIYFLAKEHIKLGYISAPVFKHPQEARGFYEIYQNFMEGCVSDNPIVHLTAASKYQGPLKDMLIEQLTYDLWQYLRETHSQTISLMYLNHALGIEPPKEDPIPTGIQNLIYMTSEIMNAPPNSIVFIDEPEVSLHRDLQSKIVGILKSIRKDVSIIFATHNVTVMNSLQESLIELPTKEL